MNGGRSIEWRFYFHHLHLILLVAGIFCLAITRILGLDIWWHLAVGRYLLQSRSFPRHDVFSFTASAWDNKEWLFGIVVYCIHRVGGVNLLTLAKAALFTATFVILYASSVRRSGSRYLSIAIVLLAALACRVRLAFRPELFSYLFIAVLLLLIDEYLAGRRKPLCAFPLLMLLWVNLHPLAFLGLIILFIYLLNEIACRLLRAHALKNSWRTLGNKEFLLLIAIFAASCLAFTCNPISVRRFLSPLELMTKHSAYISSLTETKPLPLFQFPAFAAFVLIAVFTLVMFVAVMEPADTMLLALFGAAAVSMARNSPLLPVCAAPLICRQFVRFSESLPGTAVTFGGRWRRMMDIVAAVFLAAILAWSFTLPDFGLGYSGILYPEGAVKYIMTNSPAPQMFNIYDWGGFLIWELFPRYKVFVDGRGPDAYSPEFWAEYETTELGKDDWEKILDRYGVNLILISTANKLYPLIGRLNTAPQWRLAYWDFQSMLFLRDIAENRQLIGAIAYRALLTEPFGVKEWRPELELQIMSEVSDYLKENPDSLDARNLLAARYLMKGAVDEAIGEFERVAKSHPGLKRVHYNLGMLYTQKGAQEKAMAEYEQEIVADGTFPPAYNNLGRILYERGEMVRAARCFRKAVRIDPRYIHAVNNLGLIYMEEGNYKEAVAEFTKALEIDPGYGAAARNLALAKEMLQHPAETCNRLGQLFYMQGNLDKAEQQFNKAVGHNPRYVVAIGNLGVISMKKGRYRDAARQFRQVIDIDPGDTDARRNLAMAEALLQGGVTPAAPEERR